jgi:transposase
MQLFKCVQTNGNCFRAQLLRHNEKCILWIAESEEEVYTVIFDKAVSADMYKLRPEEDKHKAILLYEQDEEVATIEIGNFTQDETIKFITWFQNSLQTF